MDMKNHILSGLREQFEHWEELLGGLSEAQFTVPLEPSPWSIKDEIAHLWAWQQRSTARVEAALLDREPEFPRWPAGLDPEAEEATDQINAWIYETNRKQPWSQVYQDWRAGFQRFLKSSEGVPERDLLASGKYPWLHGYSLAAILLASYDHHQEHREKLLAWLQAHRAG